MKRILYIGLFLICGLGLDAQTINDFLSTDYMAFEIGIDGKDFHLSTTIASGDYLISIGSINESNAETPFILKTDFNGNVIWRKQIAGVNNFIAVSLKEYDNLFYVVGTNGVSGNRGGFIMVFDADGNIQNYKEYDGEGATYFRDFVKLKGSLYVTGLSSEFMEGNSDNILVKLNEELEIQSFRVFDQGDRELGSHLEVNSKDELVQIGYIKKDNDLEMVGFVLVMDTLGQVSLYKEFDCGGDLAFSSLAIDESDKLHLTGRMDLSRSADYNAIYAVVNSQGTLESFQQIDLGGESDYGINIDLREDTIVILGYSDVNGVNSPYHISFVDGNVVDEAIHDLGLGDIRFTNYNALSRVNDQYLFSGHKLTSPLTGFWAILDESNRLGSRSSSIDALTVTEYLNVSVANATVVFADTVLTEIAPSISESLFGVEVTKLIASYENVEDSCQFEERFDTIQFCDTTYLVSEYENALSYDWTGGSNVSDSIRITGRGDYVLAVTGRNCPDTVKHHFNVEDTCSVPMWPGDCDNNGVVNVWDVIPIGITYGSGTDGTKGPIRNYPDNTAWEEQYSKSWGVIKIFGNDPAHIDANGDGMIDSSDLNVIDQNYNATHNRYIQQTGGAFDPMFFVEMLSDTLSQGDSIEALINIGSSAQGVSNLYGLAFRISFNPDVLKEGSIEVDFSESILGEHKVDFVELTKVDDETGYIDIGMTRIDKVNISDFGALGKLIAIIEEDIGGGRDLDSISTATFSVDAVNAYSNDNQAELGLNNLDTTVSSTVIVDTRISVDELDEENEIVKPSLYPNPAKDVLHIQMNTSIYEGVIEIFDATGRSLFLQEVTEPKFTVNIDELDKGVYFIKMKDALTEMFIVE